MKTLNPTIELERQIGGQIYSAPQDLLIPSPKL